MHSLKGRVIRKILKRNIRKGQGGGAEHSCGLRQRLACPTKEQVGALSDSVELAHLRVNCMGLYLTPGGIWLPRPRRLRVLSQPKVSLHENHSTPCKALWEKDSGPNIKQS